MPSLKNRFIIIAATSLAIFMLMLTAWFLRNHVTLAAPKGSNEVYLPLIAKKHPWVSPFGTETQYTYFPNSTIFTRAEELGVSWIRLNGMISWRALQPNEGDPIDWSMLSDFEDGLRTLKAAGIIPIVIADDYPAWATIEPNSCGAIRTDKFAAYADFVAQLADRYKTDEFNVHHWELGNEPDVDPSLVITNNVWGCWGDIDDPYYGGEHYGEMLKVVTPAIKAANPNAKVWIGGLLLDSPNSEETNPGRGRPELFLQGILEAGAAPYFDIVAFHFYVPYTNLRQDHDNGDGGGRWDEMGGGVLGKTSFLRNIMQQYGVTKPLFLNEMGLMCAPTIAGVPVEWCNPPNADFFEMQADHLVKIYIRGISTDLQGLVWYTLNGPGWRNSGLLDGSQQPRPAFYAYQQLIQILDHALYAGPVPYTEGVEAHAFEKAGSIIHVLWTATDTSYTISIPQAQFMGAYDRSGNNITPTPNGSNYEFTVTFEPMYIELLP